MIYNDEFFYKKILKIKNNDILNLIDKNKAYRPIIIETNGKKRNLSVLNSENFLYSLQRNLLDNFLSKIPLPNEVCGFVKGKSYLDFLKEHCSKTYYLRLDIKDFFPSIKIDLVRKVLEEYITVSDTVKKFEILKAISNIVTYERKLPQGAITSPQLSNIVFRRLDIRIRNYCRKFKINYTRYADDLLFSSDNPHLHKESFYKMIVKILSTINLRVNKKKIKKSIGKIVLNGYVIENSISLSRSKLSNINSILYIFEHFEGKKEIPNSFEEYFKRVALIKNIKINFNKPDKDRWIQLVNYLAGYRSYLITFSREQYNGYCIDYSEKIVRIEKVIDKLIEYKR